ncbi:MAG: hypothetical protein U5L02_00340 [Rheinheimera sp.]|nr:hypothetical protein [Rheinheimera sp.]
MNINQWFIQTKLHSFLAMHIPGRSADSGPCSGRREKTAQYTGPDTTMQGKCLINHRILTAFSAYVALKNCNHQLQNFELLAFTCPITPTGMAPTTFQLLKRRRSVRLSCLHIAVGSGFFAITGQKLENAASSTPAFSI